MKMERVILIPIVVLVMTSAAAAEDSCSSLKQIASATLQTMPSGVVHVPVTIAHHSLDFLLETESRGSVIDASTADDLGLARDRIRAWNVRLNGDRLQEFATADAMNFGGMIGKVRFAVAPDNDIGPGLSGILGADFLRNFDIDFDFAKSRVNLFSPDHCEGGVVYWTQSGASRVPMAVSPWGEIKVDAELEGKSLPVELATGMAKSVLMIAENETKFGVQEKEWKLVQAGTSRDYASAPAIYEHVFKSLTISGIQVSNVDLTIQSGVRPFVGAGLYLGMDILRQLHLYIAYKERNLYVSAASAAAAQPTPATQHPANPAAH